MTAERWQQIKAIFEEADAAPKPDRPALLDWLCSSDTDLRREVEALLSAEGSATFIQSAIGEQAASLGPAPRLEDRFGHYKLVRRIGQGGMGARKTAAIAVFLEALAAQRAITKSSGASADSRLDLAGQLLRHAETLTECAEPAAADVAIGEADSLLSGLDVELRHKHRDGLPGGSLPLRTRPGPGKSDGPLPRFASASCRGSQLCRSCQVVGALAHRQTVF